MFFINVRTLITAFHLFYNNLQRFFSVNKMVSSKREPLESFNHHRQWSDLREFFKILNFASLEFIKQNSKTITNSTQIENFLEALQQFHINAKTRYDSKEISHSSQILTDCWSLFACVGGNLFLEKYSMVISAHLLGLFRNNKYSHSQFYYSSFRSKNNRLDEISSTKTLLSLINDRKNRPPSCK